jgi:hypothetical protein
MTPVVTLTDLPLFSHYSLVRQMAIAKFRDYIPLKRIPPPNIPVPPIPRLIKPGHNQTTAIPPPNRTKQWHTGNVFE